MSQPGAAQPAAAAGWYPDPAGSGMLRHWDGVRWTEHVMPPPAGLTAPPTSFTPSAPQYRVAPPQYWATANQSHTNGMAIASLVLALTGLVSYGIGFVLGIVFGHVALTQIDRSAGTQEGRGLALAGLIIGYVGVGIGVLVLVAALAVLPASG